MCKNEIESDLRREPDIELVTNAPDFDASDEYDDKVDKEPRNTAGAEAENDRLDYDNTDSNDLDSASLAPKSDQLPRCRGDDAVRECPRNPHKQICESQMCDGVNDCPSGEDEDQELCRRGEDTKKRFEKENRLENIFLMKKKFMFIFF